MWFRHFLSSVAILLFLGTAPALAADDGAWGRSVATQPTAHTTHHAVAHAATPIPVLRAGATAELSGIAGLLLSLLAAFVWLLVHQWRRQHDRDMAQIVAHATAKGRRLPSRELRL